MAMPQDSAALAAAVEPRLRHGKCQQQADDTYHRQLLADEVSGDAPCCWLDRDTNRCRWYEFRPQICRDLDCGSEGCRSWRDEYNIDVARLQS